jgi:hypothetical protein
MLTFNTGNAGNQGAAASPQADLAPAGSLLGEQGVFLAPGRSSWQIGQLHLLDDRLLFVQPRGVLFDVPLAWLLVVAVERKHYVVVRKPALAVTYRDPRLRDPSTAWFLTPQLGQWVARLNAILGGDSADTAPLACDAAPQAPDGSAEGPALEFGALRGAAAQSPAGGSPASGLQIGSLKPLARAKPATDGRVLRPPPSHTHTGSLPPLTPKMVEKLARELDPSSRAILGYLADASHASIRELADVIGASSDMAVLFCIRQNINPTAQALFKRPILFFVEAQLDQVTGAMVPFAWWLAGRRGRVARPQAAAYELHDEGDRITVLLDMVGADPQTIACRVEGELLVVTAERVAPSNPAAAQAWRTEVTLPRPLAAPPAPRYNNGILMLDLEG